MYSTALFEWHSVNSSIFILFQKIFNLDGFYYYYYNIIIIIITELTQSKTILENTAEIELQPAALDFKNRSQHSSRSK